MKAYQIKISLDIVRPEVWRRAIVPAGITFSRLAAMLNDIMGWMGGHLYAVTTEERHYISGMPDDCFEELIPRGDFEIVQKQGTDGQQIEIDSIFDRSRRLSYIYDLGDEWIHTVLIEKTRDDYDYQYPRILEGDGSCPPDDCGGPLSYMELVEKPDEIDEELRDMFFEELDEFDVKEVNEYLEELYSRASCRNTDLFSVERRLFPDLKGSLEQYRVDDLKRLCKELHLSGYSGLKKSQLAELLASRLVEKETMEDVFSGMTDQDLELFEVLCQHPYDIANLNNDAVESADALLFRGYLFRTSENVYFVPEEMKQSFEALDREALYKKQQRVRTVIDYCQAAVNLYGIAETSKLTEIFNAQNETPLSSGELQRAAVTASKRDDSLVQWKTGYIYDTNIEWDIFDFILEQQKGKPYYIPEKEEFLRYSDPYYCEKALAWEAVQNFVMIELDQNRFKAELLCHELQALVHIGADMESLFEVFGEFQIPELNDHQMFQLSGMIMDAWNCTRMITNRGFTPNEISGLNSNVDHEKALPDNVIPFPGKK